MELSAALGKGPLSRKICSLLVHSWENVKTVEAFKGPCKPPLSQLASQETVQRFELFFGFFLNQNLRLVSTLGYQQGEHKFCRKTLKKTVFSTSATLDRQIEL